MRNLADSTTVRPIEPERSGKIGFALALVLVAVLIGGWWFFFWRSELPSGTLRYFRDLEQVEFCTIRPNEYLKDENQEIYGKGEIAGFAVVDVVKTNDQSGLLNQLAKADRQNNKTVASCFNPRHAIRDPGNPDNYLLICFECYQMRYQIGEESGSILISNSPRKEFESFVDQNNLERAQKQ